MRPVKDFPLEPSHLPIEDLAERIGRSVRTIHRMIKLGLPYEVDGKRFLFECPAVRDWLAANELLKVETEVAA